MSKDFLKHTHDAHRCNFFFIKAIGATVYISTIISFFPLSTILLNVERHKWNLRISIMWVALTYTSYKKIKYNNKALYNQ